jgi:hypothetical protein
MTVYEYAKHLMKDEEFNGGGIPKNERRYLDAVGFSYTVSNGAVQSVDTDANEFYSAMATLKKLNDKYRKEE